MLIDCLFFFQLAKLIYFSSSISFSTLNTIKKYQVTIEVYEIQLKQIHLDQDKSLTEKDLPSTEEMIKNEFGWLIQSGIKITGNIAPIDNQKNN